MNYDLFRNGVSTGAQPYDPAVGIQYVDSVSAKPANLDIQLTGDVKPGDSVSLDKTDTIDLFETLNDAIKYSEYPTSSPEARASLQRSIEELNASYVHMNQRRAEVGTGLENLGNL